MRYWRTGASAAIAAVALIALYRWCWLPYRCNVQKQRAQTATERLLSTDKPSAAIARRNVRLLRNCIATCPDPESLMIVAANYRMMRRSAEAIELYEAALTFDQRPEIYLQLGLTQLEIGDRLHAFDNLVAACRFDIYNVQRIPDRTVSEEVFSEVKRLDPSPHFGS